MYRASTTHPPTVQYTRLGQRNKRAKQHKRKVKRRRRRRKKKKKKRYGAAYRPYLSTHRPKSQLKRNCEIRTLNRRVDSSSFSPTLNADWMVQHNLLHSTADRHRRCFDDATDYSPLLLSTIDRVQQLN